MEERLALICRACGFITTVPDEMENHVKKNHPELIGYGG